MANTWDEVIELGKVKEDIENGEIIKSTEFREVYANKKSIRQSEFYQANNVGLKPEIIFEIHSFEFNNDEKVKYSGKEYSIIRTYESGGMTELTLSSFVGSGI